VLACHIIREAGDRGLRTSAVGGADWNLDGRFDVISRSSVGWLGLHRGSGLSSGRPHAPAKVGSTSYSYDGRGRRTGADAASGTDYVYGWDVLDRLVSVTASPGGVTSMIYDASGQRVLRRAPDGSVVFYVGGLMEITDPPSGALQVTRNYTLAGAMVAYRVNSTADTAVNWVLGDRQGSASVTVNKSSGTSAWQAYLPYGGTRTGSLPSTDHGFLNQIEDDTTTLTYLNNRYHDSSIGQFVSVDPLVQWTGEPYLYASGNPTTYSDPSGLCLDGCVVEVAGGVYLVVAAATALTYVVVCTLQSCVQSLAEAIEFYTAPVVEAGKAVVGAGIDAGKDLGDAVVDTGEDISNATSSVFHGITGLFQSDSSGEDDLIEREGEWVSPEKAAVLDAKETRSSGHRGGRT
jgi:RHS repeat-associated protein